MFITLSDGTIVNTDHVSFVFHDHSGWSTIPGKRNKVCLLGSASLYCTDEDANEIRTTLLSQDNAIQFRFLDGTQGA